MALNEKESKVFTYIKEDPFISQQEIADRIGLSRPAVANIISGLVKRGYLLGKAYVVNETRPIICIGAAALDRRYFITNKLIDKESDEIISQITGGGVALSVAENLGRLDQDVVLLSVVGDDKEAEWLKNAIQPFAKIDAIKTIANTKTGNYMDVIDSNGDIFLALAEVEIYEQMTVEWLREHEELLKQARVIIVDTSLPPATLQALMSLTNKNKILLILVTDSVLKSAHLPENFKGIKLFVTSRTDSERHFDTKIETDNDVIRIIKRYLKMGAEYVLITNEDLSIAYGSSQEGIFQSVMKKEKATTNYFWGTHEALVAGVVYQYRQTNNPKDVLKAGVVNALLTAKSTYRVRDELNQANLEKEIKRFGELSIAVLDKKQI